MIDYENITLQDIDTSKFFVDLKNPNFATALKKKNKAFVIDVEAGLEGSKVLRYIALMYDPASELRNNIPHLPSRKRICAKMAGFDMDNKKFAPLIEDMLVGKINRVNGAIVAYCFLSLNIYFVAHAAFQNMYFRAVQDSFESYDKETIKNIQDLQDKLIKNEQMIFGGDETNEMRKALYKATSKISLEINPESIVKRIEKGDDLNDMNPYPDSYKPNKITYVGVELPE